MERLVARGISKLAPLATPWIVVVLAAVGAGTFHHMWHSPDAAPWAAILLTAGTMVLTGLTWLVSHERRGPIGCAHTTLTTLLAGFRTVDVEAWIGREIDPLEYLAACRATDGLRAAAARRAQRRAGQ